MPNRNLKRLGWATLTAALLLAPMGFRFTRIHLLARLGHVSSMMALGNAYTSFSGEGLVQRSNVRLATYWFDRAGAAGEGDGDFSIYQIWNHDPRHFEMVQRSLLRGASNGNPFCCRTLGNAYTYGLYGFEKDPVRAEYWHARVPPWRP